MFLDKELNTLENLFPHAEKHNPEISKKGVGWHIDHVLKTLIIITDAVAQSNPAEYKWKFNITRFFVHTTGNIPRGKGKAPKPVQAFDPITEEDLVAQLKTSKDKLKQLDSLHPKSHFAHPYFGALNIKQTKRFLVIHTRHHLKIIRDMM